MANYTVQQLVNAGGSEWKKNELHRVYFNNLHKIYGLELFHDKTGNIQAVQLDGEKISWENSKKLVWALSDAKLYFDVKAKKFICEGIASKTKNVIIEKIENILLTANNAIDHIRLAYLIETIGAKEYLFRNRLAYKMELWSVDFETADQLLDDEIEKQLKNGSLYCHVWKFQDQVEQKYYFYTRS